MHILKQSVFNVSWIYIVYILSTGNKPTQAVKRRKMTDEEIMAKLSKDYIYVLYFNIALNMDVIL